MDVVEDIEKSFGFPITDQEAEACMTVGDLFSIAKGWFRGDTGTRCASAMAFCRLRKALGRSVEPTTALTSLAGDSAKAFIKRLSEETGLRMPLLQLSWIGLTGTALGVAALFSPIVLLVLGLGPHWWWSSLLLFGAGLLVLRIDPCVFPAGYTTFGELSEKVAALNFGQLATLGARASETDVRRALVGVLTERSTLPPSELAHGAFFFQSQMKRQKKK